MNTQNKLFFAGLLTAWSAFATSLGAQAATVSDWSGWKSGDACPPRIPKTLSVQNFGALPNDAGDDTDAMQRAADFLCQCGSGKTLVYPAGSYRVGKIVTKNEIISPDSHAWSIAYVGCDNVAIQGRNAIIDVVGSFRKEADGILADNFCADPSDGNRLLSLAYASQYAILPFMIQGSRQVRLSGFMINGHGDQTTMDPNYCYQEGHSQGVSISETHDFTISDMTIRYMATDGIYIGESSRDGLVDKTIVSNSARNALSLAEARNLRVTRSEFRDSGVLGSASDSYHSFSNRGVAAEAEALPYDGADWRREGDYLPAPSELLGFLPGNFLFDRVTVTGNLGGQMSFSHRGSVANITILNSTLRNPAIPPTNPPTRALEGGIAGLYVADSVIDAASGMVYPNVPSSGDADTLYGSQAFAAHLADMAADTSNYAKGVFRETHWFSSTRLVHNKISGAATLLHVGLSQPLLYVYNNTFTGRQETATVDPTAYHAFGYLSVFMGPAYDPAPHLWTDDVQFVGNTFYVPNSAPRLEPSVGGEIYFSGVGLLQDNQYSTDKSTASSSQWLRVSYDQSAQTIHVANDTFPSTGGIYPVDYPGNNPYPLDGKNALNLP